jgi:hypothetical protein
MSISTPRTGAKYVVAPRDERGCPSGDRKPSAANALAP